MRAALVTQAGQPRALKASADAGIHRPPVPLATHGAAPRVRRGGGADPVAGAVQKGAVEMRADVGTL